MRFKIRNLIFFAFAALLFSSLSANASTLKSGTCGSGLSWTLDNSGVLTISGSGAMYNYMSNGYSYDTPWEDYRNSIKEIVLCEGVTSIGQSAFDDCTNLTKVSMSNSVTYIGDFAFTDCTNLLSIEMSKNVGSIGKWAFSDCGLRSITIPENTYSISDYAFMGCEFLEEIIWDAQRVSSFNSDNAIFDSAGDSGNGICFIIGDTAESLPQYLFYSTWTPYDEPNIKSISGGKNLSSVGTYAFYSLDSIQNINIGGDIYDYSSELSIGAYAFYRTPNFPKPNCYITINKCLSNVGAYAFYGCEGIEKITIGNNNSSDTDNIFIGDNAFNSCSSLDDVTINNDVSNIGKRAFISCPLNSFHLGNNVATIGDYAFYYGEFKELILPDSVTELGENAFSYCQELEYLYIGKGITSLPVNSTDGYYQLETCGKLSNIVVSDDNLRFSTIDGILYDKEKTTLLYCPPAKKGNIIIPSTVTSIGRKAFVYKNSLTKVTCSLASITIPNSVTTINSLALPTKESGVVIYGYPKSYIASYADETDIYFIELGEMFDSGYIDSDMMWSLYDNGVFIVRGDGSIPEKSSLADVPWLNYREQIRFFVFERGCDNIIDYGFSNCPNLEKVYIGDTVSTIEKKALSFNDNLNEIFVVSSNAYYSSDMGVLFNKDKTALLLYPPKSQLTSYFIPNTVEHIQEYAFNKCLNLDYIVVDKNVKLVDPQAIDKNITKIYGTFESSIEAYAIANDIPFYLYLDTGSFGDNATYHIYSDNYMYICGTGITVNYGVSSTPTWKTDYNENVVNVIVEEGITGLGTAAFANCNNIESVILPDSLVNISTSAFNGCTKLKNICIPKGVTTLSNSVFYNCDGLTEIIIPNSVTTIGDYAFYSCSGLTEIRIPDSVTTIGNYAFKYSAIKDIDIGNGVTNIGEQAFYDSDLESITLGKSIKSIGKNAFTYCYITKVNLTSIEAWLNISFGNASSNPLGDTMYSSADLYVNNELAIHITIPDGVTKIGEDAFYYCDKIRSITIPSSVTHIGESAFYDCEKLLDVYFEGTREQWNSIEKTNSYIEVACIHCADEAELPYSPESDFVFSNGVISGYTGSDKIINVPATIGGIPVKMIADEAFHGASATQVYLPEGIVQIGKCAFQTSSVRRVNIPSTVKSIGAYAFYITDIVEIEIPAGIKTIPTYTFAYCSNLEKITIPSSIETMESDAFCSTHVEELHISDLGAWCNISFADSDSTPMYSNTLLYVNDEVAIEVTIPDNATQISKYAFYKYDELKSVVVPSSVKSIGDYAFYECSALKNIVIPDGITKIGYQAFYECSSLERVSIPDSVTNIGYQSFYNCSTLDYVKIGSGVKSIDNSAFAGCSKLTEVDMGDNVTYIGSGVFKDCVSLQSIIIPQVTTIPSNSFYNCYALKQIEIPKTVTSIGSAAFYACYGLTDVYYKGNKDVWATISISTDNEALSTATIHFAELPEISLSTTYAMDVDSKVFLTQTKNIPLGSSVLLACYDEFGIFTHMQRKQYDVESDHISFYVPLNVTTDNAKIMVWEDIYDMQPLCASENVITASKSYLVKYDANGGIDAPSPQIKEHDINIWLTANTPTREGYDFAGWATNPNGPLSYSSDVLYTKNEPVTLYALWEVAKYDVVYNVNGGYGYFENAIKTHNEDLTLTSQEPTKSGYTFVGWSTTPTGEVEYISNGIYSKNEDAILYAVWELEYYSYTINNGEVTITDCDTSLSGDIVIPSYKQGYPVTTIGSYAFDDCDSITSIVVPETVTTLEDYAFSGCLYVKKITLPNSIESIGNSAFEWNYYMEEVNIPDGITSIGNNTFYSCGYLKSINIPDGVTSIGISAFEGCSSLEEIDIPASVETLGAKAFSRCAIKNIKLPDNLTTIESGLFYSTGLTSITIPSNVSEIKSEAFRQCYKLTSVTIPKSVTYIGMYAFYTGDGDVYYEGTQEEWEQIDIDYNNEFLSNATIHYNQTIN